MKQWLYYLEFFFLSSLAQAEEIIFFEEPPTAKEILESFGEPVVKTRGDKKSRKLMINNPASISTTPTADTVEPQSHSSSGSAKPKKHNKKPVAFPLTFPPGSAVLSNDAQKYIDSMIAALTQQPNLVLHISGHTDIAGGDDINKPLSLKRAESVKDYLKEHNISESRLEISGDGSLFPLDLKDPYAVVNRRVQFVKINKEN